MLLNSYMWLLGVRVRCIIIVFMVFVSRFNEFLGGCCGNYML